VTADAADDPQRRADTPSSTEPSVSRDRVASAVDPDTFDTLVVGAAGNSASDIVTDDQSLELADLLNTVLDKGVIVHGDITLAVADIDLVKLNLGLLLSAFATVEQHRAGQSTPGAPAAPGSLARQFGPPTLLGDTRTPRASSGTSSGVASGAIPGASPGALPEAGETAGTNEASTLFPSEGAASSTELRTVARGLPERINADAPGVESGLARLVLTLIEVLRKVLEHQAIRRMDGGTLTMDEVERLGLALSRLHGRIQELQAVFGLSDDDLQIDLGPIGRIR